MKKDVLSLVRMRKKLLVVVLMYILGASPTVRCGNYYPCSTNQCGENGQCIAMYPSPNLQAYVRPVEKLNLLDINDSNEEDIFFTSPAFSSWEDASEYCISNDASLLDMSINNSILSQTVMARLQKLISKILQNNKESDKLLTNTEPFYYFWSGNKHNQFTDNIQGEFCQVIKIDKKLEDASGITLLNSLCDISDGDTASTPSSQSTPDRFKDDLSNKIYHQSHQLTEAAGICVKGMSPDNAQTLSEILEASSTLKLSNDSTPVEEEFIYTCQCKEGYGYENCTVVEDDPINGVNAGSTYCQKIDQVVMSAGIDESYIMFIDHVVYGKPKLWTKDPLNVCPKEEYATIDEEVCVARNSLAVVTYWCQGKHKCQFRTSDIEAAARFKQFFVPDVFNVKSFEDAKKVCYENGGSLALIKNSKELNEVGKLFDKKKLLVRKAEYLYLHNNTAEYFPISRTESSIQHTKETTCLTLQYNASISFDFKGTKDDSATFPFKFVTCDQNESDHEKSTDKSIGVICQAGIFDRNPTYQESSNLAPDSSCLTEIPLDEALIEYRFHLENNLNSREISCEIGIPGIHVDYRRGQTCYIRTEGVMEWDEARRQCWLWGGELAFPLPNQQCTVVSYATQTEELWMAGTESCGGERCEISFDNPRFAEGTYAQRNHLCFLERKTDEGCKMGACNTTRKGLCALPPTRIPRHRLPPLNACTAMGPESPGWPYPWTWTTVCKQGETCSQKCPSEGEGTVTWTCGKDGEWIGLPSLTDCQKIHESTNKAKQELNKTDSNPTEIIAILYDDVTAEEEISAGDILEIIDVLERALDVQNERIENEDDKEKYATNYTQQAASLVDDVMTRPSTWVGIPNKPENKKEQELTKIQANVDGITKSLIQFAHADQFDFSQLESLKMQVIHDTTPNQSFQMGSNTIHVSSTDIKEERKSYSFQGFETMSCILNEELNCSETDIWDQHYKEGLVKEGYVNSVVLGSSVYNNKTIDVGDYVKVLVHLYHTLDGNHFNLTSPRCAFWNTSSNSWSHEGCKLVDHNSIYTSCLCNHLTNFAIIMDVNGNLDDQKDTVIGKLLVASTVVGCTLSILCLIVCIYVFTALPGLRGDRTTIHRNLCISLCLAEILLLSGMDATDNSALCSVIAGFLHWLFLATFSWMLVEGIHVYYMLVKVFDTGKSMMWIFYTIGYGAPTAIVLLSALIVETSGIHGYGTDDYCWLSVESGLIWAFIAPVIVVLVVNTAMFIQALVIARKSLHKRTDSLKGEKMSTSSKLTLFKGSYSLMAILGLTWILGFFYFADGAEALAILFTITNSLQGVAIFIFHVLLNEKARYCLLENLRNMGRKLRNLKNTALRKPHEDNLSGNVTSTNLTRNDTIKKSSNITATTTNARSSELESARKMSMDQTTISAADEREPKKVKYFRGIVTMMVQESPSDNKKQ